MCVVESVVGTVHGCKGVCARRSQGLISDVVPEGNHPSCFLSGNSFLVFSGMYKYDICGCH